MVRPSYLNLSENPGADLGIAMLAPANRYSLGECLSTKARPATDVMEDDPEFLYMQDWSIIVEALVSWAGKPTELETSRERRAWTLIEKISEEQNVKSTEFIEQIDDSWEGPE